MNTSKTLATSLLMAVLASTAQADQYGTLFTTAEQRARLERGVSGDTADAASDGSGGTAQAGTTLRPFKLNGTLIGNSGKKEVWINGQPEIHNGTRKHSRVRLVNNSGVQFKPSDDSNPRFMKPGQVYNPQTGTVGEAYQQGTSTDRAE